MERAELAPPAVARSTLSNLELFMDRQSSNSKESERYLTHKMEIDNDISSEIKQKQFK